MATEPPVDTHPESPSPSVPHVVCLGASAGGLEALQAFFRALPNDTGAAFVALTHQSPDFKSMMPELIGRHTSMPTMSALHDTVLEPNTVYVLPPGKNMVAVDGHLHLTDQDRTPGHPLNLPIDTFLHSLAEHARERAVAVILSGTGSDGSRGICAVKENGGVVLVQDPAVASFDGMPRAALDTGVVDAIGTPERLAEIVGDVLRRAETSPPGALAEEGEEDDLEPIVATLRKQFGLDLSYLRPSMVRRRVLRRMALLGPSAIDEYAERLEADRNEAQALRQDMLIGVTEFFRDRASFDYLRDHVERELLVREGEQRLRVWVPACSSGEEVYSIAMVFAEAMERTGIHRPVKIFATDIDDHALSKVNRGHYSPSAVSSLGTSRLAKFFLPVGDGFTVRPSLREMVICARHNLVNDPPFTRLDLVSCRNFLIYLKPSAQEMVLAALHFALSEGGSLFLGSAEALGPLTSEFANVSSRHKLFRKTSTIVHPAMRRRGVSRDPVALLARPAPGTRPGGDILRGVLDQLLEGEERSAVVCTREGTVVELLGDALGVFQVPKGRPSQELVRMVRDEYVIAVTSGLKRLADGETEASFAVIRSDVEPPQVRVRMVPLTTRASSPSEHVLVMVRADHRPAAETAPIPPDPESADRIRELQLELAQTRETLQNTIEQLQSASEEQQSTNEELVASNEELQSTNEELQSVNEELFTVNDEHQMKIQELAVAAADLDNLLRSSDVGTLFLDTDLRIRKFTPSILRVITLLEHDIGRTIENFAHNLGDGFVEDVRRVLADGEAIERGFRAPDGTWLRVGLMPYADHTGNCAGVVISCVDITTVKNAHEMSQVANEQLERAKAELASQRSELEDLFSIVAHDLKRPVIALDGLLKLVEGKDDGHAEDGRDLLARAQMECDRMKRMLTDLERVSAVDRGERVSEDTDLQSWLEALLEPFAETAGQNGVALHSACDSGRAAIPRASLEQAVSNLIENALRYGCTSPSPRIDVSCRLSGGRLEISVSDNGKGIASRDHNKVFEPFRRLDPELSPGSGIGLVAARRLVERDGGAILLESEEGRGARFSVRLPLGALTASDGDKRPTRRLLVVEDDTVDAKTIERQLSDSFELQRVSAIQDAKRYLSEEQYDGILLDLSLPDGHGFELVRHVRNELRRDTPIVVITGHGEGIVPSSMTATISSFLPKSDLGGQTLRTAVRNALDPGASAEA